MSAPHAVRWAKRRLLLGLEWTRWHYTTDSNLTLCNRPIPVITAAALLPEADDDVHRVDCARCLGLLAREWSS